MSRQVSYQTKEHKGTYTKEYKRDGSYTSQELQRAVDAFHNYYDIPAAGRRWKYDPEDEQLILARYRKGGLVGKHRPEPSRKETPGAASTSTPALKTFSVYEVIPQPSLKYGRETHHTDTFTDYLARELGLKSKPRLRWFTEVVEGMKQGDGWQTCSVPSTVTSFNGLFDYITREVWVRDGLSYQREKQLLAHEYRHCWQCDNYGPDYVTTHREAAEIDADTFAAKHI